MFKLWYSSIWSLWPVRLSGQVSVRLIDIYLNYMNIKKINLFCNHMQLRVMCTCADSAFVTMGFITTARILHPLFGCKVKFTNIFIFSFVLVWIFLGFLSLYWVLLSETKLYLLMLLNCLFVFSFHYLIISSFSIFKHLLS